MEGDPLFDSRNISFQKDDKQKPDEKKMKESFVVSHFKDDKKNEEEQIKDDILLDLREEQKVEAKMQRDFKKDSSHDDLEEEGI